MPPSTADNTAELAPWDAGVGFFNFADQPCDTDSLLGADANSRLRAAKAAYDPDGLFLANHPVASAR